MIKKITILVQILLFIFPIRLMQRSVLYNGKYSMYAQQPNVELHTTVFIGSVYYKLYMRIQYMHVCKCEL